MARKTPEDIRRMNAEMERNDPEKAIEGPVLIGERGASRYFAATGKKLGDLDLAVRTLGGRRWSDLSDTEQRRIASSTGWQRYNNGWAYEVKNPVVLRGDRLDFSKAPEVKLAYPSISERNLIVDHPLGRDLGASGVMMWRGEEPYGIGINPDVKSDRTRYARTVFHELGHILQVLEGRPGGYSPSALQRLVDSGAISPPKATPRADSYIESMKARGIDLNDPEYFKSTTAAKQGLELYFTQGGEAESNSLANRVGMDARLRAAYPLLTDNVRGPVTDYLRSVDTSEVRDYRREQKTRALHPVLGPSIAGTYTERYENMSTNQDAKGGDTRADAKGGDSSGPSKSSEVPSGRNEIEARIRIGEKGRPGRLMSGNLRNYLTRKAQKLTPFIDHGLADMYTAPMFDINQMALDAKDMAPRDALRMFYGDKTDEIVDRAMALRARFNGAEASEYDPRKLSPMNPELPIRNKPVPPKWSPMEGRVRNFNHNTLKEIGLRPRDEGVLGFINWIMDRAYASPYKGGAHTAHDKSAAGHERFGHNLNPAAVFAGDTNGRDRFANDNELLLTNLYALIGDGLAFYTHRNQDEFAAAFGNLRKSIYKRSEGKLDIADPEVFERVVEDYAHHPGTYSGSWLTDDSRELLNTGRDYPGLLVPADKGTIERGNEIDEALGDPDYTHQFVKADSPNNTRAVAKGGDVGSETVVSETVVSETPVSDVPVQRGGPRIVINPTTFHNKKDALCVAFNEGFRIWMEATGFEPKSEPTDTQRKFFSDTAYADDELQLRRTILARIATFDTSVKDPTDDQLAETGSFLDAILESDWCKNDWERNAVSRLSQAVKAAVGAEPVEPRQEPLEARASEQLQSRAAMGGGDTDDKRPQEAAPQEAAPQEAAPQEPGASASPDGKPGETEPSAAPTAPAKSGPGAPNQDAPRQGAIENDIVSRDSPGSILYKGRRRRKI